MLTADRHNRILQVVRDKGSIEVQEIGSLLGVSRVTARRDLDTLATKGLLVRTRGGATLSGVGTAFEPRYYVKRRLNHEAKARIGRAAAELVTDGETVILDSGTTSFEMAAELKKRRNLTVITYDLMIAVELSTNSDVSVVVAGGTVRNNLYSTRGTLTLDVLERLHVNKAFLTADAVDLEYGVTNATIEGVPLKQSIVAAGERVILLADSAKFGRCSLAEVCPIEAIHAVITDDALPAELEEGLRARSIPVTLV
ncbi:MAG: DeoR/GlpR family DNA-binding transcription regulator [Methanocella sp.]